MRETKAGIPVKGLNRTAPLVLAVLLALVLCALVTLPLSLLLRPGAEGAENHALSHLPDITGYEEKTFTTPSLSEPEVTSPETTEAAPSQTKPVQTEPTQTEPDEEVTVTEETKNPQFEQPDTPTITVDYAELFASVAAGELGVRESNYNNVKYNTWYFGKPVSASNAASDSYAWCVTFICWCANEAGISTDIIPRRCNVGDLREFFIEEGCYFARSSGYTPKVGDIVFFGKTHADHVGIVESVGESVIVTIEGNSSNKVNSLTYSLFNSSIIGYASPDFTRVLD